MCKITKFLKRAFEYKFNPALEKLIDEEMRRRVKEMMKECKDSGIEETWNKEPDTSDAYKTKLMKRNKEKS